MPVKNRLAELQEASKYVTQKDIEAQKMDSSSGQEWIPMLPLKDMSKESKEFFERIQLVKEDIDTVRFLFTQRCSFITDVVLSKVLSPLSFLCPSDCRKC